MRNFCCIVPYKWSKICSFLRIQTCLSSQRMDEHCNYKTHKRLGFISKRIGSKRFHQNETGFHFAGSLCCTRAVPCLPGQPVTCSCRWASAGSTCAVSTAPRTQQCRPCAVTATAGKDVGKLSVSSRNKWPMKEYSGGQWLNGKCHE